jgi:hypothetical protein
MEQTSSTVWGLGSCLGDNVLAPQVEGGAASPPTSPHGIDLSNFDCTFAFPDI